MGRTWRIGEVAERTGLTRRTLRHYDELGLLVPSARSQGDYRLYGESDLLRLLQIQSLKSLGLSLPEIADALADPALDAASTLRSHLEHLEARITAEQRLAKRLRTLAAQDDRSWEDVLDTIARTQRLAHPDPIIRIRSALNSPGSTAELLDALADEADQGVQEVLVWSLAQAEDVAAAVTARLKKAGPELRCRLIRVLGKAREVSSVPALIEFLSDPHPQVVANSVRALAAIADQSAAAALVGLLGSPAVGEGELLDAIQAMGLAALEPLVDASGSPTASVRAAAVEAIGQLATTEPSQLQTFIALLEQRLTDPDREVRLAALLALGQLGPPARSSIELALDDPSLANLARRLLDLHAT